MKYLLAFFLILFALPVHAQNPTYVSGFCSTTPSLVSSQNGSNHFIFLATNGATGCSGSVGTVGLPTTQFGNGWACTASDMTVPDSFVIQQTGFTLKTATFKVYSRTTGAPGTWAPSDNILFDCQDF